MEETTSPLRFTDAGDKLAGILQLARHSRVTLVYGTGGGSGHVALAPGGKDSAARPYDNALASHARAGDERERVVIVSDWSGTPLDTVLSAAQAAMAGQLTPAAAPQPLPRSGVQQASLQERLSTWQSESGIRFFFIFDRFDAYLARPFTDAAVREFDLAFAELAGAQSPEVSFLLIMDESESAELSRYAHRIEDLGEDYLRMPDFGNMAVLSAVQRPLAVNHAATQAGDRIEAVSDPLSPARDAALAAANAAGLSEAEPAPEPAPRVHRNFSALLETLSTEPAGGAADPGASNTYMAVDDQSVVAAQDGTAAILPLAVADSEAGNQVAGERAGDSDKIADKGWGAGTGSSVGSDPILLTGGLLPGKPASPGMEMQVRPGLPLAPVGPRKFSRRTGVNLVLGVLIVSMLAAAPYFYAGKNIPPALAGNAAPRTAMPVAAASASTNSSTAATTTPAPAAVAPVVNTPPAPQRPAVTASTASTAVTPIPANRAADLRTVSQSMPPAPATDALAALLPHATRESLAREQQALHEPASARVAMAPARAMAQNTLLIRVSSASQRARIEAATDRLASKGVSVGEIGSLRRGSTASELRYFHAADKVQAQRTFRELRAAGVPVRRMYRVWQNDKILPGQYELWLGNARAQGTASAAVSTADAS